MRNEPQSSTFRFDFGFRSSSEDKSTNLTFVDFLEALGRVAHFANFPTMEQVRDVAFVHSALD